MSNYEKGSGTYIHESAKIGNRVKIGNNCTIEENVVIGDDCFIGNNVILGEKSSAYYTDPNYENAPLVIGAHSIIRSGTILYNGSTYGDYLQTGNHCVIREGNIFGKSCMVGSHTQLENGSVFGNGVRILSLVEIGKYARIGNYVWVFAHAIFADDPHPPCGKCISASMVGDYSIIGPHTIIMPKLKIGNNSIIGANSVVTKDIESNKVAMGTPAVVVKDIADIKCHEGLVVQPYPWFENLSKQKMARYNYDKI